MHLDLTSSSLQDQQQRVATALRLGAEHLDVGQGPDEGHVVLADPEGNEFCVIEPGNRFLAPRGGPKGTWGGPPVAPKTHVNRLRFDLTLTGDPRAEAGRLIALGAELLDAEKDDRMTFADRDGNEFCLGQRP